MKKGRLLFLSLVLLISFSCSRSGKDVGPAGGKVEVSFRRFEKELFALPVSRDSMKAALKNLAQNYSVFLPVFNTAVLNVSDMDDPLYYDVLDAYLADRSMNILKAACDSVFSTTGELQGRLDEAFTAYHQQFANSPVPEIITFLSGLNQSFVSADSLLGISLDKYLGFNHPIYAQALLPLYQRRQMREERIVPDCLRAWLMTEFPAGDSVKNLLDHILYEGRMVYIQRQLLPGVEDSLVCGFTSQQMEWCKKYENRMWTYLVENKIIFQSDAFAIARFVQDGPFTKDFSNESPARAAVWIGMRIVESYCRRNPDVSLERLMHMQNCYAILEGSGYNP